MITGVGLFGYQVSDSRTEVSDVWDSPMHLYIFSPYTVGRKFDFFLSYAQHSRDFSSSQEDMLVF